MSERLARLHPKILRLIDHRDESDDAAVAAIPIPREECESAAFARHGVEVAADVLGTAE